MQIAVESGDEHEALRDDRSDIDDNELVPRKCRVRPVHIFIGIACAMTLCGFVLTVYGGVKIYYHDVFKVMSNLLLNFELVLSNDSKRPLNHAGFRRA